MARFLKRGNKISLLSFQNIHVHVRVSLGTIDFGGWGLSIFLTSPKRFREYNDRYVSAASSRLFTRIFNLYFVGTDHLQCILKILYI